MRTLLVAAATLLLLVPAAEAQLLPEGTHEGTFGFDEFQGRVIAFNDTMFAQVRFRGPLEIPAYRDTLLWVMGRGTLQHTREQTFLVFEELQLTGEDIGILSARRPGIVISPIDVRGLEEGDRFSWRGIKVEAVVEYRRR